MPTRRLSDPQTLDDLLLYVLWNFQSTAGGLVTRLCEVEFGITRREWRLLAGLALHEGLQPSELAERIGLDRARTSRALTTLAHKQLIQRTPRPGDHRQVLIHLTAAGRRCYDALLPRIAQINRDLLAALDGTQQQQLDDLLWRLQQRAESLRALATIACKNRASS